MAAGTGQSTPPTVFLSYARKDGSIAAEIRNALEADGIDVWVDTSAVRGGDQWRTEIVRGIEQADSVVVLLSRQSIESKHVLAEVNLASERGKRVVPARLDSTEVTGAMAYTLAGVQEIDLRHDRPAGIGELLAVFGSAPIPPPRAADQRGLPARWWKWGLIAVGSIAAATAGVLLVGDSGLDCDETPNHPLCATTSTPAAATVPAAAATSSLPSSEASTTTTEATTTTAATTTQTTSTTEPHPSTGPTQLVVPSETVVAPVAAVFGQFEVDPRFDLDRGYAASLIDDLEYDTDGLRAVNAAKLALHTVGDAEPSVHDCYFQTSPQWDPEAHQDTIPVEQLDPGTYACVFTSSGKLGWLRINSDPGGDLVIYATLWHAGVVTLLEGEAFDLETSSRNAGRTDLLVEVDHTGLYLTPQPGALLGIGQYFGGMEALMCNGVEADDARIPESSLATWWPLCVRTVEGGVATIEPTWVEDGASLEFYYALWDL